MTEASRVNAAASDLTRFRKGAFSQGHAVRYNAAGQRDRVTQPDGQAWEYGYNIRGEVTGGSRRWSDGTPVSGQQFGYHFDWIGNRQNTTVNGRSANYIPNPLNEYVQRAVPGVIDVSGEASPEATVTVNGSNAIRRGGFFYKDVPAANASSSAYPKHHDRRCPKSGAGRDRGQGARQGSGVNF